MPHSVLAPLAPCRYLPDRAWQLRYEVHPGLTASSYMDRLAAGWRRFGPVLFRPECPGCHACQSLRVPVATFQPHGTLRTTLRRNDGDVTIRVGSPSETPEKVDLLQRFHTHGTETKGWPAEGQSDLQLFILNPFRTEEWSYWVGERLIAVGYVDVLPAGLSAIYFYWEPAEAKRSLGTYNILKMIEVARQRRLPHVYLGYYVEGYRSLEYKARFHPNEIMTTDGCWRPFVS